MNTSSTVPAGPEGPGSAESTRDARRGLTRRGFAGAAAATALSVAGGSTSSAAAAAGLRERATGSVATSPRRPADFARTCRSRFIMAGGPMARAR